MKNIFLNFFCFFFLIINSLPAQKEIKISAGFIDEDFTCAYLVSHTVDNNIFDVVRFDSYAVKPDFFTIKVPSDSQFHALTVLVRRRPTDDSHYHRLINVYTIWDNKNDTISNIDLASISSGPTNNQKVEVNIKVSEVGKLDDLYSLSTRENLTNKVVRSNGNRDIEFDVDSYSGIGRCIYIVNKRDEEYREIVVHPAGNELYGLERAIRYGELPIHTTRETLDLTTNHKAFVQINANSINGDVYNLYTSPRTLEKLSGLEFDVPASIEVKDYNISVILRDFESNDQGILVTTIGQKTSNIFNVQLPEIEDVSYLVSGVGPNYTVDLDGKKFDKWSLQFRVEGLEKSGVKIPWENVWPNYWTISGEVKLNSFEVFIPALTDEIADEVFGGYGEIQERKGHWRFLKQKNPDHVEISSFQRY